MVNNAYMDAPMEQIQPISFNLFVLGGEFFQNVL